MVLSLAAAGGTAGMYYGAAPSMHYGTHSAMYYTGGPNMYYAMSYDGEGWIASPNMFHD
jgi:hypothetical protein